MKITGVQIRILRIDAMPWYGGKSIPHGEPEMWNYPLISVSTDEGIDGYSMGYGANGEGRSNAYVLRDVYIPAILGEDPLMHEAIWNKLRRLNRHLYGLTDTILGQLDVAFWDIKGKVAGLPIATLLGLERTEVPSYGTGSYFVHTPEETFCEAKRLKESGYRGCKFNMYQGPVHDIPRLRAAREATGPDFPLMLDGSSFYSPREALEVGHALDELNFYWFEEPVYDRQLSILKMLADQLRIPILAGETVSLAELPRYLQDGVVDLLRGDVHIKAGITGLRKAMAACELFGINLEIHTATSPLLDVANLHVACSVAHCAFIESHHSVFRFGLKNSPLDIDRNGFVRLPIKPGLGVELDWDWIENHTVEVL